MEEIITVNGQQYIIELTAPLTQTQRNEVIKQLGGTPGCSTCDRNNNIVSLGTPSCTTSPIKRGTTKDIPCTATSTNASPNFTYTLSVSGIVVGTWNSGVTTSPNTHTFLAVPFNTAGIIPILLTVSDGCSGGTNDTATCNVTVADPVVNTVTVTGCTTAINVGTTCTLIAACVDQFGGSMICPTTTWSSSNTLVATVNSTSGLVTGISSGTSIITATSGGKSGTKSVTVSCSAPSCSFTII